MSVLDRFDIRTLLACQILLSTAFSIVFFGMSFAYRRLHGISSIALGFFLNVPGALLIAQRGSVSDFLSIVVANSLIFGGHFCLYFGVLQFFAHARKPRMGTVGPAAAAVVAALFVITWYSMVDRNIVPRILAAALTSGLIFAMMARHLLRRAKGRRELQLFACIMLLHSATTVYRAVGTAWLGAPTNLLQGNNVQAFSMISNVIFISALGIFFQIMIAGERNQAVESRARLDLLTGTFNRLGIEERLCTELDRAHRNNHPLSALLIDVDRFKSINDAAGHAAGDEALRLVSQGILTSLRSYDLLGRYGGDEFLLLLPETTAEHAVDVANRIRRVLAVSAEPLFPMLRPTLSIGVAENLREDSCTTLLARADAALYDAKLAGRDCVRRRDLSTMHPKLVDQTENAPEGLTQEVMTTES